MAIVEKLIRPKNQVRETDDFKNFFPIVHHGRYDGINPIHNIYAFGSSYKISDAIRPVRERYKQNIYSNLDKTTGTYIIAKGNLLKEYNVFVKDEFIASVYHAEIFDAIEKSKYILSYKDNWDDEGSKGYKIETWKRAISFIAQYEEHLISRLAYLISPSIEHGPMGSIDIIWRNDSFRLLVNIPEGENHATFYGDNRKSNSFKGTLVTSEIDNAFSCWLANLAK